MQKNRKQILKIAVVVLLTPISWLVWRIGLYHIGDWFGAGRYPFAQVYDLAASETRAIEAVKAFKRRHPEYAAPRYGIALNGERCPLGPDGRSDSTDYVYRVNFYYPQEHQLVYAWLRPTSRGTTDLALVAFNQGLALGHWKDINCSRDFGYFENRAKKRQFEERILTPLQLLLEQKTTNH